MVIENLLGLGFNQGNNFCIPPLLQVVQSCTEVAKQQSTDRSSYLVTIEVDIWTGERVNGQPVGLLIERGWEDVSYYRPSFSFPSSFFISSFSLVPSLRNSKSPCADIPSKGSCCLLED